jgi:xanthine dehydrogenase accessory factor
MVRGGGDLGSGVVLRLHRAGAAVLVTELAQPIFVRRMVSFGEAIYRGKIQVEEVSAVRVETPGSTGQVLDNQSVAVLIDPDANAIQWFKPQVVVDARLLKEKPEYGLDIAPLVIGLGPGFVAGEDCHAVIETKRGPNLGRVYWHGPTEVDTKIPESVSGYIEERVLRAPCKGVVNGLAKIGDLVSKDQVIAHVGDEEIKANFNGVVRGLIADGILVERNMKIGDLDPRQDPSLCYLVSDKSLAIGGAVLEAVLTRPELRTAMCGCNT